MVSEIKIKTQLVHPANQKVHHGVGQVHLAQEKVHLGVVQAQAEVLGQEAQAEVHHLEVHQVEENNHEIRIKTK